MSVRRSFGACCNRFATLSRSAAKAASAQLRRHRLLDVADDWHQRANVCARCPMSVLHKGKLYCGTPLLMKVHRDPVTDGCGCPCVDKAKDASEHCPVDSRFDEARIVSDRCTCKWCS